MGFLRKIADDNTCTLTVTFEKLTDIDNYFNGDSIQAALEYFNIYVKNNIMYVRTEEEIIADVPGAENKEEAIQLRKALNNITASLTDTEALQNPILFPKWQPNNYYETGTRLRYENNLFKVLQSHTSTEEWNPMAAPSLFAHILTSEDGTPQEWQQPSSTNAYLKGDRVIYNGQIYESLINYNVWRPDLYPDGWKLITE